MLITDYLEHNARHYGLKTALVEISPTEERDEAKNWRESSLIEQSNPFAPYRRDINWRHFDLYSNRIANLLLSRGVEKGTKVALLLSNCLEWLPLYFGILKAGCVVVPLNFRYDSDEIKYCCDLADVEILMFGREFKSRINRIHKDMKKVHTFFYIGFSYPEYAEPAIKYAQYCTDFPSPVHLDEEDEAAIYFSSGTTGFPKAILHNHKSLLYSCITEQENHHQNADDCFLLIPPLYHTGAKMHWFGSLISHSKAVILRGVKPEWIMRAITEEKCTIVWLLVPWAQDILDAIDDGRVNLDDYYLDQWRLMHIGAQPVPPSLIKRWKKVFPNHDYDTNYGLSESLGPGCVHLGIENTHKVGAIGIPGNHWQAKIVDDDLNEVENGVIGELAVKGPSVMLEYYKDKKATDESLKNGWLLTGDTAEKDKDGFIYLVDRKKDVIISGGENLYPVQIENFIRAYPKVKDVAVIGTPDERLGEIATAIIEVKSPTTEEEINEFCMDLPRYKRPRKIIFDDIPRNPTGKIEKPVLRKKYCAEGLVRSQIK